MPSTRNRRDGKITLVTLFAILGLVVMAGFVGNVGQTVSTKIDAQNAADAVAFSSAQWMARGMNAVTATNHMLGEVTGLCVVIEALGGPELDAGMKAYTSQNQTLDTAIDTLKELAPAPKVSPYPTAILNAFEEPLIGGLSRLMVPDDDEQKKSRAWATIYDSKLQVKFDAAKWMSVDALANLLFLIPPPWGYPAAAAGFVAHAGADIMLVKDGQEWVMLQAMEIVMTTGIGTQFKNILETAVVPALAAHGDFIAGRLGGQSGQATAGVVNAGVDDALGHLGKTYALKAFIFPAASSFRMPIEAEPGPSLQEGTPAGRDELEWGGKDDSVLIMPDVGSKLSDINEKVFEGARKLTRQIGNLQNSIDTYDRLEKDIDRLAAADGVTPTDKKTLDDEKAAIGKARAAAQEEQARLKQKLRELGQQQAKANQAMGALNNMPPGTGNISAKRPHLALSPGQMKESEERYTQWVRATFPYVDTFRAPIIAIFDKWLDRSGAAGHYEKWTNRYTLTKSFQFRSGFKFVPQGETDGVWQKQREPLAMYVMTEAFAKTGARRDRKGHETWTLSTTSGKEKAEELFTVIGFAHRDINPMFSPVIYPYGGKHGATTFAQAVFYNGNEQKPAAIGAKDRTQAKLGWDTLNWDPTSSAPEWGNRIASATAKLWPWELLTSSRPISGSSSAKVRLNWQAKLMPVTKTRLKGAVTMPMSVDMNANVAEAFAMFDQMMTH
jgi:hypothetical protein